MILFSICLVSVLLFCLITRQSPRKYVQRLRAVNWHGVMAKIKSYCLHLLAQLGRYITRPFLQLYYSIFSSEVPILAKILIYGCLIYIVWTADLMPYADYRIFGFIDDIIVMALINFYIKNQRPPSVDHRVNARLHRWFGFDSFIAA